MCQRVLCLYTGTPAREMSSVHLQSWSATSRKSSLPIQNSSHLGYRIFLHIYSVAFIQDFQIFGSPVRDIDMVEEM